MLIVLIAGNQKKITVSYGTASMHYFTKTNKFISIILKSVVGVLGKEKHEDRQDFTATMDRSKYKLKIFHTHDMSVSYCRTFNEKARKCMYGENFKC
jgi:hypothetical protein